MVTAGLAVRTGTLFVPGLFWTAGRIKSFPYCIAFVILCDCVCNFCVMYCFECICVILCFLSIV
jgi:hypothetical protein